MIMITAFQHGYQYAKEQWESDQSPEMAKRLHNQANCSFDNNDFDRGMLQAIHDLNIPDPVPYFIQPPQVINHFEGWSDEKINTFMQENSFLAWRRLEDGEYIGLIKLLFTMSVCTGIEPNTPYKYRWCFKDAREAINFYGQAKEFDEIPEQRTSLKGHRYLPNKPLLVEYASNGFPKW